MWDYTEKVKEHFLNPRNAGEMDEPDAVGRGNHRRQTIELAVFEWSQNDRNSPQEQPPRRNRCNLDRHLARTQVDEADIDPVVLINHHQIDQASIAVPEPELGDPQHLG